MRQRPDEEVIDWPEVINDLVRRGMRTEAIAERAAIPRATLNGYRNQGAEPKHSDGERLLELWRTVCMPRPPRRKRFGVP